VNIFARRILGAGAAVLIAGQFAAATTAVANEQQSLYIAVRAQARPPIGWVEFCATNPAECVARPAAAGVIRLTKESWGELVRINKTVNDSIKPITDIDHWGVIEKWSYPTDGYGDCEDYVLLKRRMLINAGWPAGVLLITVVRDRRGDGHAVLTVRTDNGELILDNQNPDILLWSATGYRYVKRQSETDPNTWVSLSEPPPAFATAAAR